MAKKKTTSAENKQKVGFDNELYLKLQSKKILEKAKGFKKLYLEFGGKLFDDFHASRVLTGFDTSVKTKLLASLGKKAEILFCIPASEIERNRQRGELGLNFENDVLKHLARLRSENLYVSAVVITLFKGQTSAVRFAERLKELGETVYIHNYTKGYPSEIDVVVSDEGYGANPYIKTTRPIVVVTATGHNTGKLATCLSQMYHDYKNGIKSGYAKFETFPVWNLPLKHPINIAYESATADIKEINQIDPYHFSEYGKLSVNYSRDIEAFPIVNNILKKIGHKPFKSPTDMGVNIVADAIIDDKIITQSANKEIIRRYFKAECDYKRGTVGFDTVERTRYLMSELDLDSSLIKVVPYSKMLAKESGYPCVALELADGRFVGGKNKTMVSACGAVVLNALRILAGLDDNFDIIADDILLPIVKLKRDILKSKSSVLTIDDVLIALAISAEHNEKARKALEQIPLLAGTEAHSTFILSPAEEQTMQRLLITITSEPILLNVNGH